MKQRLMARAAEYRDAIGAARLAGMTWTEIGERLGVSGAAMRKARARARVSMEAGRLVPIQQLPLPEPALKPDPMPPAAKPRPALSEPLAAQPQTEGDFMSRFSISKPTQ